MGLWKIGITTLKQPTHVELSRLQILIKAQLPSQQYWSNADWVLHQATTNSLTAGNADMT